MSRTNPTFSRPASRPTAVPSRPDDTAKDPEQLAVQPSHPYRGTADGQQIDSRPASRPKKTKPTTQQTKIIKATGKITDRRTSNKAQQRTCQKCRQTILAGLDAHTLALDVNLDPTPLNHQQQLAAIILGWNLYDITQTGHINWRTHAETLNRPPPPDTTRHTTHSCGQHIPNHQPPTPPPTLQPDTNERPPF